MASWTVVLDEYTVWASDEIEADTAEEAIEKGKADWYGPKPNFNAIDGTVRWTANPTGS